MKQLVWKRDPLLDTYEAKTDKGTYTCMRTYADVAKLWFNGEVIRSSPSDGGHTNNIKFAEEHYKDNKKGP